MASPRSQSPTGRQWERVQQRRTEETRQESERRKHEENERIRAQVGGLPSLQASPSHRYRTISPAEYRPHENVPELDTSRYSHAADVPNDLPTPPPSEDESSIDNTAIEVLQREVSNHSAAIHQLELELSSEQSKVRDLQAERYEAKSAYTAAILANDAEVAEWKKKVSSLTELLDEYERRERELEHRIDEGRKKEAEMRRELLDAKRHALAIEQDIAHQSDGEVSGVVAPAERRRSSAENTQCFAEHPLRQQQQSTDDAVRRVMQRQQALEEEWQASRAGGSGTPSLTSSVAPSGRSRRHSRQMADNCYVSFPKARGKPRMVLL
ncbi:hypothetical protein ACLMJK_003733 [Lecanora helva]